MVIMSNNIDGEQKSGESLLSGTLHRLFSCEAQVFVLSQNIPGIPDWVELSDKIIPVHIMYCVEKNVYSILCVQHNKVIINSPIDQNFALMKGSPKFLQYNDSSTLKTCGIGFEEEKYAEKFDLKVNEIINELKKKVYVFTPTSFIANGTPSNALETNVGVDNSARFAPAAQIPDLKQAVDNKLTLVNSGSPSCDLMSIERDRVKNALFAGNTGFALIHSISAGTPSNSVDLERIMKKMENLERENKNLRDCIFSEVKEINPPKPTISESSTKMLLDRCQTFVAQNDVNALADELRHMYDTLNNVSKEKHAAEKKLFTVLRICKDTQAALTSAMTRINEIEGLVESQLK